MGATHARWTLEEVVDREIRWDETRARFEQVERLYGASGEEALRLYLQLIRQDWGEHTQELRRIFTRAASQNPLLVNHVIERVNQAPIVPSNGQIRSSLIEVVGSFKSVWALEFLNKQVVEGKSVDVLSEFRSEEEFLEFLSRSHAAGSLLVRNDKEALVRIEKHRFKSAPKDRYRKGGVDALKEWWLENQDRIPDLLDETYGDEVTPDPRVGSLLEKNVKEEGQIYPTENSLDSKNNFPLGENTSSEESMVELENSRKFSWIWLIGALFLVGYLVLYISRLGP